MLIVFASRPYFAQLDIELPGSIIEYLKLTPLFIVATFTIGVLAGFYPSVVLSAFNPILALRGNLKSSTSGAWLRKSLMVFQFAISLGLIAASLIIVSQMDFIQNKELGFDRENILRVQIGGEEMSTHFEALKNKFVQNSHVAEVAKVSHSFDGSSSSGPAWLKGADQDDSHQLAYYQTGHDFLKVTGVKLLEGRYFSKDFPTDTASALVLNQTAVAELGLESPIGQKLTMHRRERTVIGVVEDFHYSSLHTPIAPMAIVMPFAELELMLIKTNAGNIKETLTSLENDWREVVGSLPFEITFLDDGIQAMYEKERKLSSLITIFSTLAVLIACLGLYGLVAFSVNSKLKEVGIRKVLGASISKLLLLLSRQFIILILIANFIAWPVTWYFIEGWLNGFEYRIGMGMGSFIWSAIILLIIAILTISQQTIKAALTNPVKVLRNE